MKVRFEIDKTSDITRLTEKEFIVKIDKSIAQADSGETKKISRDEQKELLGL